MKEQLINVISEDIANMRTRDDFLFTSGELFMLSLLVNSNGITEEEYRGLREDMFTAYENIVE